MTSKEFIENELNALKERLIIETGDYPSFIDPHLLEKRIKIYQQVLYDLEILDILKNKKVDIDYLSTCLYEDIEVSVKEYNAYDSENNLTKDEIILLKEWLDEK